MSIAKVEVIRAFRVVETWFMPSKEPQEMPADAAREWESKGYCEVIEVDGRLAVFGACCGGGIHNHG